MGFLEKIIVTPSHHRVHHAINKEYIDKNYGQIFIFWDKLFGTYQEELTAVPPVYGITRPVRTWNPIKINFQHLWLMMKDAWHTNNWKDKLFLWFKPTGYRPADVAERFPVYKIDDPYQFEKYDTKTSPAMNAWSWTQLFMILLFTSYLFGKIAFINSLDPYFIYWYGAFIFLSVYAITELMDRNPNALFWEGLKMIMAGWFLYRQGDWFGASAMLPSIKYIVPIYFIASLMVTAYFVYKFKREDAVLRVNA